MRIHILGAGTPKPSGRRFGSAWLIDLGTERILFDCGPATTQKMTRHGIEPTSVDRLFFTHHHFDHDADYPAFALSRWDQGADLIPDLRVYGPPPTRSVTDRLFGPDGAFAFDIRARVGHPSSQRAHQLRGGSLPRRPLKAVVEELGPGSVIAGDGWRVTAAHVRHAQPFLDSLAYRLEDTAGTLVISGDCVADDAFAAFAAGAHTLLMMCWDRQAAMAATGLDIGMTGTSEAGRIAAAAGVRRLVLVHLGPTLDGAEGRQLAAGDVSAAYDGELVVADEDTVLEL